MQTSIDMTYHEIDTSAILIRRAPPEDLSAPGALFGLWLVGGDSFIAYDAPADLIDEG